MKKQAPIFEEKKPLKEDLASEHFTKVVKISNGSYVGLKIRGPFLFLGYSNTPEGIDSDIARFDLRTGKLAKTNEQDGVDKGAWFVSILIDACLSNPRSPVLRGVLESLYKVYA